MDYKKKSIDNIPSENLIVEFEKLISNGSATEPKIQRFIEDNPNLLAPLEMSEFVRHLQYPTRNIKNPSAPANYRSVRIPDFDGVTLTGLSFPVIIEMKKPSDEILNNDGSLSNKSIEVINQLGTAVLHMLRTKGQEIRAKIFDKPIEEVLEEDLIEDFKKLDSSTILNQRNATFISIMKKLIEHGCGLIALIGQTNEFKYHPNLLIVSREAYLENGVLLLTYDELLMMNRLIKDWYESNHSLYTYFDNSWKKSLTGTLTKDKVSLLLTNEFVKKVQSKIYSLSSDVCIFGFGSPLQPSKIDENKYAIIHVNDHFSIKMMWAKPTYLKGEEKLLWAGKYKEHWIVVKERLTSPLKGGILWYVFLPPSDIEFTVE